MEPHLVAFHLDIVTRELGIVEAVVDLAGEGGSVELFAPACGEQMAVLVREEQDIVGVFVSAQLGYSSEKADESAGKIEVTAVIAGGLDSAEQELSFVEQIGNSESVAASENELIVVNFHGNTGETHRESAVEIEVPSQIDTRADGGNPA